MVRKNSTLWPVNASRQLMWHNCDNCQGTGHVSDVDGNSLDCPVCHGTGRR
jgi:DnaJ-class molecular chaperone